jgi:hypothetical protein
MVLCHIYTSDTFQNYGCNLGQTNNGKRCNTTYHSLRMRSNKSRSTIWRICSDNDDIMYEVTTLEQMME